MNRSDETILKLRHIDESVMPPEAWIWLMRLECQYGLEGAVRNRVNFYIENRGKEFLRVILPDGASTDDVGVIWIDNRQTAWSSEDDNILTVAIPSAERYFTVSIEFSYKNYNPRLKTDITPRYPKTDIPILGKNCIVWFPPDYRAVNFSERIRVSEIFMSDILKRVASLLSDENKNFRKAALAFQCFDERLKQLLPENSDLAQRGLAVADDQFTALLLQKIRAGLGDAAYDASSVKFYVDAFSFSTDDAMPKSTTLSGGNLSDSSDLLIGDDLATFISVKNGADGRDEYSFYFTSFLTAGLFQFFNGRQIGNRVWFVDSDEFERFIASADEDDLVGAIYELSPSVTIGNIRMLRISDWIRMIQKVDNVFGADVNQSFWRGNISSDWRAYEISDSGGDDRNGNSCGAGYFLIRVGLLKCYYLAALIVAVVLLGGYLFCRPVVLIFVMLASQLFFYILSSIYVVVLDGVFVGAAISFVFTLIRLKLMDRNKISTKEKQSKEKIQTT
jgi:hypothetical protein